jgi:hypothetical protein
MLAHRLRRAYRTGKYKPNPGSWCANCAAPEHCTLPRESRPAAFGSHDELVQFVRELGPLEAQVSKAKKAARAYIDEWGIDPIVVGDQALGIRETTTNRMDKKLAQAAGVDLEAYKVPTPGTEFSWKKVN